MHHHKLLIMIVVLVMCGGVTVPAAAQDSISLRIGLLASADSSAGLGAQLAIAEINANGGITGEDGQIYRFDVLSVPVTTSEEILAGLEALHDRDLLAVLGPSDTAVTLATFTELNALQLPVLLAATGDMVTIADTENWFFRVRAAEQVYVNAMAAYLADRIEVQAVAVVELGDVSDPLVDITTVLSDHGVIPLSRLQLNDPDSLDVLTSNVMSLNPSVLVVWGVPDLAASLLVQLRNSGWEGEYFYRQAAHAQFVEGLQQELGSWGVVQGVTNWVPGVHNTVSDQFLTQYALTFGIVPDALSAAYYDAVYLLAEAVTQGGGTPEGVRVGLGLIDDVAGAQGIFAPGQFVMGETISAAVIYELNRYGVPQAKIRFVDGLLTPNVSIEITPTPVATPTPVTPTATPTITPTATPEGLYAVVDTDVLNIRSGPGTVYDSLGQFERGDTVFPVGAAADLSWLVVPYRGATGWVATNFLNWHGDLRSLPTWEAPPTPVGAATETPDESEAPSSSDYADLIITDVTLAPQTPQSGQPFDVQVTIYNEGTVASRATALAATFLPGDVFVSTRVPAMAPGQGVVVSLVPTLTGTGTHIVEIVVDLNDLVPEDSGEANNLYPLTYTLTRETLRAGSVTLLPGQEHDLMMDGITNLRWEGDALRAVNGSSIMPLDGISWAAISLADIPVGVGDSVASTQLSSGRILAVQTPEELGGYVAVLRVDGLLDDALQYTFEVLAP